MSESEIQKTKKAMVSWSALLDQAVTRPGFIHEAYSRFHNFSMGNQLLALLQCDERGIQPGPLATFPKWKELGRSVKKGEKALILCMPIACKHVRKLTAPDGTEREEDLGFMHFRYKAHWFVLAQTEGDDYVSPTLADWQEALALETLRIERIEFTMLNGNTQGYAQHGRKIAINPMAALPHKTLFHELGHCALGHCDDEHFQESETSARDVREVEAEAVALLCCESLVLPGAEYSRGYIQSWRHGQPITERSAQRIFRAADQILRAGRRSDTP